VVSDGVSTVAREAKMRIRLGSETDGNVRVFWEVKHFDLPVVDFIELG
jgi:hypothetical protein